MPAKKTPKKKLYAAVQLSTRAVYGLGRTREGALKDARRWTDGDLDGLTVVSCTSGAWLYVAAHGGSPTVALVVNRRGVRMGYED